MAADAERAVAEEMACRRLSRIPVTFVRLCVTCPPRPAVTGINLGKYKCTSSRCVLHLLVQHAMADNGRLIDFMCYGSLDSLLNP